MDNQELAEIKSQVSEVQILANSLFVTNQEEADNAAVLLKRVKEAEKFVDEKKTDITRPLMKALSNIRDLFKPIELNLADATKTIKAKILAFTLEEQEKIEKERAKIEARVAKGTMKAATAANKLGEIGSGPKSDIRTLSKIRIVDETIIPREWMEPSITKIKQAVLRDGIKIPGVEVYEEKQVVVSRQNV